jgi:flagellar motor switch protein FliG
MSNAVTSNVSIEKKLTDAQKVAILLASLKESAAATILQQLNPHVLARVAEAMRNLGFVPGEVRERVVEECFKGITNTHGAIRMDDNTASNLLTRAIGEKRTAALLQDTSQTANAFSRLAEMSAEQILSVLGREQPNIIAMVIRYLEPTQAAEILNLLPHEVGKRVMYVLCTGKPPSEAVVARTAVYIESRLGKSKKTERVETGDIIDRASNILQSLDHALTESILLSIDETNPQLGTELRDRLFSFEDIVRLSDADMRRVMQEVDIGSLAISLRSAPIDVREKFFSNMSKRAVEGLKEDMQYAPKMKLSEIEAKQKEIINMIRELDAQGEISIQEGGANEYV